MLFIIHYLIFIIYYIYIYWLSILGPILVLKYLFYTESSFFFITNYYKLLLIVLSMYFILNLMTILQVNDSIWDERMCYQLVDGIQ